MKVYVVFRGTKKYLLCVCKEKETAIDMATDDAAEALLFEKFGDATDFKGQLSEYNEAYINGVWYSIVEKELL